MNRGGGIHFHLQVQKKCRRHNPRPPLPSRAGRQHRPLPARRRWLGDGVGRRQRRPTWGTPTWCFRRKCTVVLFGMFDISARVGTQKNARLGRTKHRVFFHRIRCFKKNAHVRDTYIGPVGWSRVLGGSRVMGSTGRVFFSTRRYIKENQTDTFGKGKGVGVPHSRRTGCPPGGQPVQHAPGRSGWRGRGRATTTIPPTGRWLDGRAREGVFSFPLSLSEGFDRERAHHPLCSSPTGESVGVNL